MTQRHSWPRANTSTTSTWPAGRRATCRAKDEGDNYVDGFRGLKLIGYQDFVSFECGCKGDRKRSLTAAVKLLRDQWAMA